MGPSLAIMLACLLQEPQELAWKFKEGRTFEVSWVMALTVTMGEDSKPSLDTVSEYAGTLKVLRVDGDRADCEFMLERLAMKGKAMAQEDLDILIEGGEVKRAGGGDGQAILNDMAKPTTLTLDARGGYTRGDGPRVVASLFSGKSDFFGPQLPARPVAVGGQWSGTLRGLAKGATDVEVSYTLAAVDAGKAVIRLDVQKEQELRGADVSMSFKSESEFDVAGGYCRQLKGSVSASSKDEGRPFRSATTLRFTCAPVKE